MADYSMRARNAADTAYVSWVVVGTPDPVGTFAPEAIFAGSAVVLGEWGGSTILLERVVNEFTLVQSTAVPVTVTDPGVGGMSLVLVDTANVSWAANDAIHLPGTLSPRARVVIKDATGSGDTKPITVNGNGHDIDRGTTVVMGTPRQSLTCLNIGSEWMVV